MKLIRHNHQEIILKIQEQLQYKDHNNKSQRPIHHNKLNDLHHNKAQRTPPPKQANPQPQQALNANAPQQRATPFRRTNKPLRQMTNTTTTRIKKGI